MNYTISTSGNSLEVSQELAKLAMTGEDAQVFETITHPDTGHTALVIGGLDTLIKVHPNKDLTRLKELLTAYDQETKDALESYIDSIIEPQVGEEPDSGWVLGRFPFRNVVEGYVTIYDQQYMFDNGWPVPDPNA
jgi:hypothetical protein